VRLFISCAINLIVCLSILLLLFVPKIIIMRKEERGLPSNHQEHGPTYMTSPGCVTNRTKNIVSGRSNHQEHGPTYMTSPRCVTNRTENVVSGSITNSSEHGENVVSDGVIFGSETAKTVVSGGVTNSSEHDENVVSEGVTFGSEHAENGVSGFVTNSSEHAEKA
jgi:hypothetical protein